MLVYNLYMQYLPFAVILVLVFALGVRSTNFLSSPIKNSTETESNVASDSAELDVDSANRGQIKAGTPQAEKVPTKTFNKHGNTYTSQNFDDKIVMKGTYRLSTYDVEFTINLPKSGGAISGSLSNTCEGPITGNASAPNQNNTAEISGSYSGKCKPIPTLSFGTPMSGDFSGKVYYDEGKAAIIVNNKEPISINGTYFEMFF